ALEALTDEIESEASQYIERIENSGGMLSAIESGWIQNQIHESAYQYQQSIEKKGRLIVGVNAFHVYEDERIPIHVSDPAVEAAQIESLSQIRAARDIAAAKSAVGRLEAAARGTSNLMPYILEAVEAYATIGEISDTFRRVHGEYREA